MNKEIEQLIQSTPLEQMSPDQALRVIQYAFTTENKSEIKPEFLDLSARCRYFNKSIIMMNEGVTSDNLCQVIFLLLRSVSELSDDFLYFLLFCFLHINDGKSRFDFSDISSHISSFSEANIYPAAILLISYIYLNPDYDIKQLESLELTEEYQKPLKIIIDSYKDENSIAPYLFIKNHFEKLIQDFSDTIYPKLSEAVAKLKSDEVNQRINELTNSLTVSAKSMPKNLKSTTIEEYKEKFLKNVQELEDYMKSNFLSSSRVVRLATTKANSISDEIERLNSELQSVKELVIDAFLSNPTVATVKKIFDDTITNCVKFSTQPDSKLDFTSSLPTFLFLTSSISLLKLYMISVTNGDESNSNKAQSKLRDLGETISTIVDRLKTDIPLFSTTVKETIRLSQSLNDKDDRTYRSVHSACDSLLLWLHFSECGLLDGIVREEAVLYAEKSSFYPEFARSIFTKVVKKGTKDKAKAAKKLREDLYQTVSLRYSSFIAALKLVPGMRKDSLYKDFVSGEKWPWPKMAVANVAQFPQEPDSVRQVLRLRSQIAAIADGYKVSLSVPLCKNCNKAVACVVCPKCRKLVLCNSCKEKLKKCPCDGCDHVFE